MLGRQAEATQFYKLCANREHCRVTVKLCVNSAARLYSEKVLYLQIQIKNRTNLNRSLRLEKLNQERLLE